MISESKLEAAIHSINESVYCTSNSHTVLFLVRVLKQFSVQYTLYLEVNLRMHANESKNLEDEL